MINIFILLRRKVHPEIVFLLVTSLAFMMPRLLSPQFGLLDDGVSINTSRYFIDHPIEAFKFQKESGRFIPGYWLTISFILNSINFSVLGSFLVNWLLLFGTVISAYIFLRWRGISRLGGCLACILFIFSVASVENYYTLSKTEPIVLFWVISGLLLYTFNKRSQNIALKFLLLITTSIFLLNGYLSKEPTIIFTGITLSWMFTAYIYKSKPQNDGFDFKESRKLFIISLLVFSVWFISCNFFVGSRLEGGYASNYQISIDSIKIQAWRWIGYILRDYSFLFPLGFTLVIPSVRKRVNSRALLDCFIWMIAWGIVYLPWKSLDFYYTLPFNFGASLLGGILLSAIYQVISDKSEVSSVIQKRVVVFGLATSVTIFAIGLVNCITQARLQLLIDMTNSQMVNYLSKLPQNSQILFNTPQVEYVNETRFHLKELYSRQDLNVSILNYQSPVENLARHYWVINPVVNNMPMPSVRSSLQNEAGVKHWNQCFKNFLPQDTYPINEYIYKFTWVDWGLNRFLPNLGMPDPLSQGMFESVFLIETTTYGWEIYTIQIDNAKFAKPGSFNNGSWNLMSLGKDAMELDFGFTKDKPLVGDFDGNGWSDVGVYRATTGQFILDTNLDGVEEITIVIEGMKTDDIPLIGDWDGDGKDTVGYFRSSDTSWNLLNQNKTGSTITRRIIIGVDPSAIPLVGDWNGDGSDTFGLYLPNDGVVVYDNDPQPPQGFSGRFFVDKFSLPVVGDWFGFGIDTVATVTDGEWTIRPTNFQCYFPNPLQTFTFGQTDSIPVVGVWKSRDYN